MMKLIRVAFSVVIFSLMLGVVFADNSHARSAARNDAEASAKDLCSGGRRGAIWFGGPDSSYYDMGVNITSGAPEYVTVYIRGSVYGCSSSATGDTYAVNIASRSTDRLDNISSTSLHRGSSSGAGKFSSQGGSVTARLRVGDLALNSRSQTIHVSLFRCFSTNSRNLSNTSVDACYPETIPVTVNRVSPPNWSVTTFTSISSDHNGSLPGQDLGFHYRLSNTGNATASNVNFRTKITRVNNPYSSTPTTAQANSGTIISTKASGGVGFSVTVPSGARGGSGSSILPAEIKESGQAYTKINDNRAIRRITDEDTGKWICSVATASPSNNNNASTSSSRCKFIHAYGYNLKPSVAGVAQSSVPGGSIGTVTGSVDNEGPNDSRNGKRWQLTSFIIPGNNSSAAPAGGNDANAPCGYSGAKGKYDNYRGCKREGGNASPGSQIRTSNSTNPSVTALTKVMPEDSEVGDRLCFVMSVTDRSHNSGTNIWAHSAASCTVVGKLPKVNVLGGDLWVRKNGSVARVSTSFTINNKTTVTPSYSDDELSKFTKNTQSKWYIGEGALLDFSSGSPVVGKAKASLSGGEGITIVTDKEGVIQFITDGQSAKTIDNTALTVKDGKKLGATFSTTQAAAAFPLKSGKYMVVTSSAISESNSQSSRLGVLNYAIVDMNASPKVEFRGELRPNGSGVGHISESLNVVPDRERSRYWVVTNRPGTVVVNAISVPYDWDGSDLSRIALKTSSAGSSGVASDISGLADSAGFGTINFSKDYTRAVIASAKNKPNSPNTIQGSIRVLSFDIGTGSFEKMASISTDSRSTYGMVYSADFSEDSNIIYATSLYMPHRGAVYKYVLNSSGSALSLRGSVSFLTPYFNDGVDMCGSNATTGGQVKRGPDGVMYIAMACKNYILRVNKSNSSSSTQTLSSGHLTKLQLAAGSYSLLGLPQTSAIIVPDDDAYSTSDIYGSFAEYGIAATGNVRNMASSQRLNNGYFSQLNRSNSYPQCSVSLLTFGNSTGQSSGLANCNSANIGDYANIGRAGRYLGNSFVGTNPIAGSTTAVNPGSLANGVHYSTDRTSNLTISGANIQIGKQVVINVPNANVIIDGDINYASSKITSLNEMPQLVIVAKNVFIRGGVGNVDAWIIASGSGSEAGYINTCYVNNSSNGRFTMSNGLNSNTCNNQLVVNGPVSAEKLLMRRTYGAGRGGEAGVPAEIFNFRPDAYLWLSHYMGSRNSIPTSSLKDLPPRY